MFEYQHLQSSIAPAIVITQRNDNKKSSYLYDQSSIAPGIIIAKKNNNKKIHA
ncbi:MAG: hypothetical protein PWQ59_852 [Thermoanaerobacterium sp.]|jgi:hypothetical protein|uniref:hypothetical protein n=1 Tax=Thermoanaerobacterium thermosaccharolyticum TaxID=1517 RepID=UPI0024AC0CA7|nr:hypothetical protein [Thermoanaerobacterium sp.]MDK2806913.1 hypothetical protein [Thermoanaerobacterium sp.]MDN5316275.1 hypothetical protein [Thermoanaerobacterium sp.]WHE06313.1 hypothetical protein PGH24_09060 [Thermoanaerobacterium thermosaccharolyticum]